MAATFSGSTETDSYGVGPLGRSPSRGLGVCSGLVGEVDKKRVNLHTGAALSRIQNARRSMSFPVALARDDRISPYFRIATILRSS